MLLPTQSLKGNLMLSTEWSNTKWNVSLWTRRCSSPKFSTPVCQAGSFNGKQERSQQSSTLSASQPSVETTAESSDTAEQAAASASVDHYHSSNGQTPQTSAAEPHPATGGGADGGSAESLRPAEAYKPPGKPGPSNRTASELPQPQGRSQSSHQSRRQPQGEAPPGKLLARKGGTVLVKVTKNGPVFTKAEDWRSQPGTVRANSASSSDPEDEKPDLGTFWGLLVLGLAYVHHSTTGFALPALLPLIAPDLKLTDTQGSLLTAGYTVLYAVALIPAGFLADKADRPRLLAGGLGLWSVLTMLASKVGGFGELLATRILFAAAQATQNPICFSLIPELFRKDRTTAMAAYNSAIYMGRALSFAAVIVAGRLSNANGDMGGVTMVPLDSLDLSHVSILYTQGEMAAITPIYDYQFSILQSTVTVSSWRQLLFWLGPPGLAIAALALLTLDEPRKASGSFLGDVFSSSKFTSPATRDLNRSQRDSFSTSALKTRAKTAAAAKKEEGPSLWASVKDLCSSPVFQNGRQQTGKWLGSDVLHRFLAQAESDFRSVQAVTLAAALNDVGSWALVSWQATFYQRVYELGPETYAPMLAGILPVGGILGGVGGGLMGDWLSKRGGLILLTSGATIAASPVLVGNILAPTSTQSFGALLVGFALSEMWRAPAAIMIRDISPPNLGSTGSALHLCFRNLVGGMGPISVAFLNERIGLQRAMLLVPACYLLSGVGFFFAHRIQDSLKPASNETA